MGMYSKFIGEEITVTDSDKLKILCFDFKGKDWFKELVDEEELAKNEGTECVSFYAWDDCKIQGYWYNEMLEVLNELATCIEGYAEFMYEEGYYFRIVFEKGKWFYQQQPEIDWTNIPKERIRRNKEGKMVEDN